MYFLKNEESLLVDLLVFSYYTLSDSTPIRCTWNIVTTLKRKVNCEDRRTTVNTIEWTLRNLLVPQRAYFIETRETI